MQKINNNNKGAALLVVLFIVMTVTVLGLGFLSRSDAELAGGENMILRAQMDYLAESGLTHAKGIILNPQDVVSEYWAGAAGQQLAAGDDYYDVNVVKLGECNYQISCDAYRQEDGEQIGRSSLQAELRLDPCITYWQTDSQTVSSEVTINGDVYCDNNLTIAGTVNGDAYSKKSITGTALGQIYSSASSAPVSLPGLVPDDFSSTYYIGSTQYSVGIIGAADLNDITLGPTADNPAGIYYYGGALNLRDDIYITGMLVVGTDLYLRDNADVIITAIKNFPALLVGNDIRMENDGMGLNVTGLAQIGNQIDMQNKAGSSIDVLGALYIFGDGIINTGGCSVTITAAPNKAAIQIWPTADNAVRWSPAAGAFFKSIERE